MHKCNVISEYSQILSWIICNVDIRKFENPCPTQIIISPVIKYINNFRKLFSSSLWPNFVIWSISSDEFGLSGLFTRILKSILFKWLFLTLAHLTPTVMLCSSFAPLLKLMELFDSSRSINRHSVQYFIQQLKRSVQMYLENKYEITILKVEPWKKNDD